MKKLIAIITVLALMLVMCSCQPEHNVNTPTDTTAEEASNPLAGAWAAPSYNALFVFNNDCTLYSLVVDKHKATVSARGSYKIVSDSEVISKWYDANDQCTEERVNFSLEDGNLIIDNDMILKPVSPPSNSNESIVGAWEVYGNDLFNIRIGTRGAEIDKIVFYNDGSYSTSCNSFYGRYAVVQDGNAVQLYSSGGSSEDLYKITFLGCGLIIFELPDNATAYKSYVLRHIENH